MWVHLLAIYLAKRGHKVTIFERRGDMRTEDMSAGRSINLALSDRGMKALEEVGIMSDIRKICIPMNGRFIHNADGHSPFNLMEKKDSLLIRFQEVN